MAVLVTDYTSFNAQLNRQIGADSDSEVAATRPGTFSSEAGLRPMLLRIAGFLLEKCGGNMRIYAPFCLKTQQCSLEQAAMKSE